MMLRVNECDSEGMLGASERFQHSTLPPTHRPERGGDSPAP